MVAAPDKVVTGMALQHSVQIGLGTIKIIVEAQYCRFFFLEIDLYVLLISGVTPLYSTLTFLILHAHAKRACKDLTARLSILQ